ncbi:TssN family type VI secretion system protein [Niabella sp. CC-SYL272]|uniref:TssN family type VI secretion system protein n=1 Tax=Niabella agricola TaxID=2891571 RepID=UPI001F350B01|nr:TssN family type VI secretion system protein [Niabella agricola]MCF3111403.1 TssN family type VI secretion system protein [Niabella agricola]
MENWFSPSLKSALPYLGISFISMSVIMGLIVSKIRGSFKPFTKPTVYYILLYAAGFAVIGLLSWFRFLESNTQQFLFFQFFFLWLGILHVYTLNTRLKWVNEKTRWAEVFLTLAILFIGGLCFMMTYRLFRKDYMDLTMATAAVIFFIPLIVYYTYKQAVAIPFKILKQWHYPAHIEIAEVDEKKLRNLLVISFEFHKKGTDKHFTNFRAKAPVDMEFGELFYYFINDYNERHPSASIAYINDKGAPSGWIFFKKPKWYTLFTKYIDPERTIFINKIKENDIIICSRVS